MWSPYLTNCSNDALSSRWHNVTSVRPHKFYGHFKRSLNSNASHRGHGFTQKPSYFLAPLRVINSNFPAQLINTACSVDSENLNELRDKVINQFQDTLSNDLSPNPMEITDKAMHMYLQPNAIHSQISIAQLIPLLMQRGATQVITYLLHKQVITKVNKPTQWGAPGFFVSKPNGTTVHLVTYYTKLHKFVKRPIHPFPSATEIMQSIPETAFFSS